MNAVADTRVADLVGHARALVLDFDGTLVGSNPIKWRALEVNSPSGARIQEDCSTCLRHRSEVLNHSNGKTRLRKPLSLWI